jgi:NifU-like protein involved in Fe-S cluster formation
VAAVLYTPGVLALATELAAWPPAPHFPLHGSARSPACGSSLSLDLSVDQNGRVDAVGIAPRACAIGQAAAAIFAKEVIGRDRAGIAGARDAIAAWLDGTGGLPDWPGLDSINAVPAYAGRHGAVLLSWNAALAALGGGGAAR